MLRNVQRCVSQELEDKGSLETRQEHVNRASIVTGQEGIGVEPHGRARVSISMLDVVPTFAMAVQLGLEPVHLPDAEVSETGHDKRLSVSVERDVADGLDERVLHGVESVSTAHSHRW